MNTWRFIRLFVMRVIKPVDKSLVIASYDMMRWPRLYVLSWLLMKIARRIGRIHIWLCRFEGYRQTAGEGGK